MLHLSFAIAVEIGRLALWLALLVAVFVPLERYFHLHRHNGLNAGRLADIGLYFGNSLLRIFILSIPLAALVAASSRWLPASYHAWVGELPIFPKLAFAFLLGEVGTYWGHRLSHEWPLLWRFHALHHSASEMDWLINSRSHPIDMIFTRLCGLAPIALLGLIDASGSTPSIAATLFVLISTFWGFFIHANIRWEMNALSPFVATPRFHHWHHVASGSINRNYASTLPLLDRIWGTYHLPRRGWPASYGIDPRLPD